ncbi:MAG: glycosyltransferase family 39 protein, partial [bacterium]|nr:glycosyltransferase family 39 protein [bacterium]
YPDDWRITNYNPVLPYIKYSLFKAFGVGLLQMRLVSHIFAFLTLLFFFLTLRSHMSPHIGWALTGTLLLGINFLYTMYNKIGTFETSMIFWVILTLYFLEKYRARERAIFLLLSGASAFTAFIFKSIMLYALPVPFVACILLFIFSRGSDRIGFRESMSNFLFILLGVVLVALPWYLLHYLPNKEWILSTPGKYMSKLMLPTSLDSALNNFVNFPWKAQFYKIPIIWLGAVLYVPVFVRNLVNKRARLTEIAFLLFFFAHTFFFFFLSYRPTRYFIPVIPAMVFMTILLLKRTLSEKLDSPYPLSMGNGTVTTGVLYIADTLWLVGAAYFCFIPLIDRYFVSFPLPPFSSRYLLVAGAVTGLLYFFKNVYRKLIWRKPDLRLIAAPLILLMLGISCYSNLHYYFAWNRTKTHNVRDMSVELGEKLDNAYIAGMTASVAVMENRHKVLWLYPNFVNWSEDLFEKYPLTHALLGTDMSREVFNFFDSFPARMQGAGLRKVFHIKNYFLHLYSFTTPYLKECQPGDEGFRFVAVNPSHKPVSVKIGVAYHREDATQPTQSTASYVIEAVDREYQLQPGENILLSGTEPTFKSLPGTVLFFLEYKSPWKRRLRYEGENFNSRVGEEKRVAEASGRSIRFFNNAGGQPGFVAYGPAVPYAAGLVTANFHLRFDNAKTKIKPVCNLDIYSHTPGKAMVERSLKPSEVRKSKNNLFSLSYLNPETAVLEFRVQARGGADILFDYMDLVYYPGIIYRAPVEPAKPAKP